MSDAITALFAVGILGCVFAACLICVWVVWHGALDFVESQRFGRDKHRLDLLERQARIDRLNTRSVGYPDGTQP